MRVGARWLLDWDDPSADAEPWLDFTHAADGARWLRLAHIHSDADFG
ncbi:hypothetical protein [Xanthomonas theicola]|nr:hypothetical protein [Xanthomonas theicola]QNH26641.1 hypothetical protein G4Q83_20640 [Xanthomonas theicola]